MIRIYSQIPASVVEEERKNVISDVGKWFKANPTRKTCRTELWYGRIVTVKRKTYADQINEVAKQIIKGK